MGRMISLASLTKMISSQNKLLIISGFISMATLMPMGYANAYPNTAIESFKSFFNISMTNRGTNMDPSMFSWVWSAFLYVYFPGFLVGTLCAPKITDRFGRKKGLLLSNFMSVIGTLISLLALPLQCPELLIAGRITISVASAIGMCSLILFLQEVSPTVIRGLVSSYPELCLCFNSLLGSVCGLQNVLGSNLFSLIGLPIIFNLLVLFFLIPCPETPKFLLINKKDKVKALLSIAFYHGVEADQGKVLESISAENQEEVGGRKTTLGEIWRTPFLRKAQMIGTAALLFQNSTGISALVFLSSELFVRAGLSNFAAEMGTVSFLAVKCIATYFAMLLVDRCGRRPLLLGFGVANIACITAFTICAALQKTQHWASYGCLAALLAFAVTFSFGLGPLPWFITAEMVPQRHRSLVQSVALTTRSMVAFFTGIVTLPLYDAMDSLSFIPLFIIPSIFYVIFLYKKMPETKGQEVHVTVAKLSMISPTIPHKYAMKN